MQNPAPEWIEIKHGDEIVTIEFTLTPTQQISPSDLQHVVNYVYNTLQNIKAKKIRVTGRGPVWLYAAVVHTVAHLAPVVQVFDAVQKRWISVTSHTPDVQIGDVEYV